MKSTATSRHRSPIVSLLRVCVFVFAAQWFSAHISGQDDHKKIIEIPEAILQGVAANATALESFELKWTFQNRRLAVSPSVAKAVPDSGSGFWKEYQVKYRFDKGKYRVERINWNSIPIEPSKTRPGSQSITESSFNGENFFQTLTRPVTQKSAGAVIVTPVADLVRDTPNSPVLEMDYFRYVGIVVPNLGIEHAGNTHAKSSLLELLENGGVVECVERQDLNGVNCWLIRIEQADRIYAFWFDADHGYAVRKRETRNAKGQLLDTASMSDFRRYSESNSLWLPYQCNIRKHVSYMDSNSPPQAEPIYTVDIQVHAATEMTFSDEIFLLNYLKPGVIVADGNIRPDDENSNDLVSYVVPGGKTEIDAVVEEFFKDVAVDAPQPANSIGRWGPRFVILFNLVAIAIVMFRRLKPKSVQT